nr:hypothetical protein [Tanacetum cinerariifolium]
MQICALVIVFGDSYVVPASAASAETIDTTSDGTTKKKGRTVTVIADDMQRRKNDVKARTTLLLSLPDEHQLRFTKHNRGNEDVTTASVSTASTNVSTASTNVGVAKSSSDEDQNRNPFVSENVASPITPKPFVKFVKASDIQSKSKTDEKETPKKPPVKYAEQYRKPNKKPNNLSNKGPKNNSVTTETASDGTGKKSGRTVTVTTEDIQKRKNDVNTRTTLLLSLPDEHQLRFSKYKTAQELYAFMDVEIEQDDLNQKFLTSLAPEWLMHTIVWRNKSDLDTMSLDDLYNHLKIDKDNIEEMDIKWNMALLSMRADRFWKKTALMAITSAECKVFDNSLCSKDYKKNTDSLNSKITDLTDKLFDAKNMIYHYKLGLAQVESRLVEHKDKEIKYYEKIRGLELDVQFKTTKLKCLAKELETLKKEKKGLDGKLAGFLTASKNLDNLIESQRLNKNKDRLGDSVVPPPPAQIYSSPKKDLSWTSLLEFKDDTITDYSRPAPTIESTSSDYQNRNPSVCKTEASPNTITPKPFIMFVKPNDSPSKGKTDKVETSKKPQVKKFPTGGTKFHTADMGKKRKAVKPSACSSQDNIDDKVYWDSGCSRHMIGNISYLSDYEPFNKGYVSFGQGGCNITGKGTIKTGKLKFENVYFLKDL